MTTRAAVTDVQLKAQWVVNVGYRYDVILDGETIVSKSRDPEHEAARVLLSRGLRGQFRTIDFTTGRPRMTLDIEKAARLTTVERDASGPPVIMPYRSMSDDDKTRARIQRTHQGPLFLDGGSSDSRKPFKRAGGESGVARRRTLPMSERDSRAPSRRRQSAHRKEA